MISGPRKTTVPCLLQTIQGLRRQTTAAAAAAAERPPLIAHLRKCTSLEDLETTFAATIKTHSLRQNSFFTNQFVSICSRLGRMDYAVAAFAEMVEPNAFVYNAMIKGFSYCSLPMESLRLYLDMCRSRVSPTCYTFSSLVKACALAGAGEFGLGVHGRIRKLGFASHVFVQTALVDFYADLDGVMESRKVFDEMTSRDAFAWTTMMTVLTRYGDMVSARELFDEMPERSIVAWNAMIMGYAKVGDVEAAASLFAEMPVKDAISWTSMISCFSQNKLFEEAIETYRGMMIAVTTPDEVAMTAVLSACAHVGAVHVGKEIHQYVLQNAIDQNVFIGSALIDMYAKCGNLERSLMIFFKLRRTNLYCWNSALDGLAVHGRGEEALRMFNMMEINGEIKPNGVTFISILSGCTHAGLVDEGRRLFTSMTDKYNITPAVEHYGCIVDLLSRAGLLEEALEIVRVMEVDPNSVVWGALLGGCKIHKNLEVGRIAAAKLATMQPNDVGYHLLSLNLYAGANQWNEVARVRESMSKRCVQKSSTGHSWIEMDGNVHRFMACDDSHSMMHEIHLLMGRLNGQLTLHDCF